MSKLKHFRTAKENQTAPTLNNASIYRAGQNPTRNHNDSDDEDEPDMIKNSFYVPDRLHSQQQPTFVDALKRRRDHTGRIITKSQVLQKRNRNQIPERLKSESPPIYNNNSASSIIDQPTSSHSHSHSSPNATTANHVQFNNLSDYPCAAKSDTDNNNITTIVQNKENEDGSEDEDSSDSDSDFDMNNLTVPKVEPQQNNENGNGTRVIEKESIDLTNTSNEADAIREKLKQRLKLQRQKQSESQPQIIKTEPIKQDNNSEEDNDSSGSGSEESSEYETASSSDEEEAMHPRRRKIRFLNEKQREEQYAKSMKPSLDEQAEILEKMEEDRLEKLKESATEDALNYIREQDKQEREGGENSDEDMPDDNDDDPDGEEGRKEFERWKLRELKRMKRDEEFREQRENEKLELEKRRKMTDEEIMKENEKLGLNKEKKKGSMKFMQKYYHQGVFYRDGDLVEDKLLNRDFNQATGQDKYIDFDKVPEAMKRKNFGKMSQSKWTHLANEDTTFTKEEREWFKKKGNMTEEERKRGDKNAYKFRHRAHQNNFWFNRAGSGSFDRPSYKKGNVNNSSNTRFERTEDKRYDEQKDRDRGRRRDRDRDRKRRSKSPYRSSRRRR